jgi:predicted TIM-barrel fold metal-dependent hydrolase
MDLKREPVMRRRTFLATIGGSAFAGAAAWSQVTQQNKRYRVIDTHVHIFNTHTNLPAHFKRLGNVVYDMANAEAAVNALRRGGVDKAFLISYTSVDIHQQMPKGVDPRSLLPLYSKDYAIATWKKHPDLFYWFPDHIDPSRPGYLDDLQRDLEMGASGIKLLSVFHGFFMDHPGFLPVYEMCRKYKKPIITDVSYWYLNKMPAEKETPQRRAMIKTYADYAKLMGPIFRQFADVPFSMAHAGAVITDADHDAFYQMVSDHPNVSCDIAAAAGAGGSLAVPPGTPGFRFTSFADWMERMVRGMGAERIMYGTDWPYWSNGPDAYRTGSSRWTRITDDCPFLGEGQKQAILAGNAERFVKFELPAASGARRT